MGDTKIGELYVCSCDYAVCMTVIRRNDTARPDDCVHSTHDEAHWVIEKM